MPHNLLIAFPSSYQTILGKRSIDRFFKGEVVLQ